MVYIGFFVMLLFDAVLVALVIWLNDVYSWGMGFGMSAAIGALIVLLGVFVWVVFFD